MVEFKKGYWNLEELKVVEWKATKTKGFLEEDVKGLLSRIKNDINEESSDEVIKEQARIIKIIEKRFGFK